MTAVIAAGPSDNRDLLCRGPKSLLDQASVPGRLQKDGWGIGWFAAGGAPALVRSAGDAAREKPAFRKAAARAASGLVSLAHLRDASNPGGLARRLVVAKKNTQPFSARGWLFCHNGTLFIKDEIRKGLGRRAAALRGNNDSEVLFQLVLKHLDGRGSPLKALGLAVAEIRRTWRACRKSYPALSGPYRGLNVFLASKDSLTVMCNAAAPIYPAVKAPGAKMAVLTPGWEFGRIAWRREPGRVVFSSEPADGGKWNKMRDLQAAHAKLRGGRIELSFSAVKGTRS